MPFTPTTLNNVNSLKYKTVIQAEAKTRTADFSKKIKKNQLKTTLPAPVRNSGIPEDAQWLSGEGAGSRFHSFVHLSHCNQIRIKQNGQILDFHRLATERLGKCILP